MFIRETVKSKKGKKYIQHQLVESIRTPNGPRQKLILNLGPLDLPKSKWKELANSIDGELHKESKLFSTDSEIDKLARHYAKTIIKERLNRQAQNIESDKVTDKTEPLYETVDINSVSTLDSRTEGAEHLVTSFLQEYKVDRILRELKFNDSQIDYTKMLITGRLVHPGSERETVRWINESSAICELLKTNVKVYDNALHRTSGLLLENHEKIEQYLSRTARDIFDLKENIVLYDLTNSYFEGSKRESLLAKPGRSKERRNDRPLVTLALTVDEDGFPKQSKILSGNISEPKTLESMLNDLSKGTDGFNTQKTIVIDAGIASEENLNIVKDKKFKYVAVSRKRSFRDDFWNESTEKEIKFSDGKTGLKIKYVKKDGEAWVLCHSEMKEAKEKAILEKKLEKFEGEVKKIHDGLTKKRAHRKYGQILERIGRLKERYGVGSLYNIDIQEIDGIVKKIDICKNPKGKTKEKKVGEYILRTNRLDLTGEEVSKLHRSLTTVENSFRSMKSHLGLRPIHHKRDDATTAHIFITVIAYHILAGIMRRLKENGINYDWGTIRNIFSTHVRVTTTFKTKDKSVINIRNTTSLTLKQQEIYKCLNLKQQPLKSVKIKTSLKKSQTEKM